MYTRKELEEAIEEVQSAPHSVVNCEKLAALYTVLDHLDPLKQKPESTIDSYGESDFLKNVSGKPAKETWLLIDELVEAISVLNPKLLSNFYIKLNEIRG